MNLKKYDNKCVRIKCIDGKIYEGICYYDFPDYCFHEYGKDEEAVEILHFLFYKSDIEKIESLEKVNGVYGRFSEPFGEIEKETVNDIDLLEQAFECEENEHIYRLLLCLETKKLNDKIIKLLKKLIKDNSDQKIINKTHDIIKKYEKMENVI